MSDQDSFRIDNPNRCACGGTPYFSCSACYEQFKSAAIEEGVLEGFRENWAYYANGSTSLREAVAARNLKRAREPESRGFLSRLFGG